jgi:hypothetical protein
MLLEPVEHREAVHARHVDVERHRVGLVLVRQVDAGASVERHQPLEALVACHLEQDLREAEVVLDHQHHRVALLHGVAVVLGGVGQVGGERRAAIVLRLRVGEPCVVGDVLRRRGASSVSDAPPSEPP